MATKIYTRTGDTGTTSLVGGERIDKGEFRLECYGTVDELNAVLGLVVLALDQLPPKGHVPTLKSTALRVQNQLFNLGSRLACLHPEKFPTLPNIQDDHIAAFEREIDELTRELPNLKSFIIPGGSNAACHYHLARTIARQAERAVVHLQQSEEVEAIHVRYLNRLSDYLFTAARYSNFIEERAETLWEK